MSRLTAILFAVIMCPGIAAAQNCKKGIRCGNTCIAANKTCRVGAATPTSPATTTSRGTEGSTAGTSSLLGTSSVTANSNASFQDAGGGRTVLLPAGTTATLLEGFTTIEPILSATGLTFVDLQLIDVSAAGARVESRLRFLPVEVDGRAVIMAQRFAAPTDAERISQAAAWMREVCRRSKHKCRQ